MSKIQTFQIDPPILPVLTLGLHSVVGTGLNSESQLGGVHYTDKETGEERIIDVLLEPTDIELPLANKLSRVTQGRLLFSIISSY